MGSLCGSKNTLKNKVTIGFKKYSGVAKFSFFWRDLYIYLTCCIPYTCVYSVCLKMVCNQESILETINKLFYLIEYLTKYPFYLRESKII